MLSVRSSAEHYDIGEGLPGHFRAASPEQVGRTSGWEADEDDAALSPTRPGIVRSSTCSLLAINHWPDRLTPPLFDEPFSFKYDGFAYLPFNVGD